MMEPLDRLSTIPAPLGELRATLIGRAEEEGIVDALYRPVDTPIGPLMIVASARGVVRVGFSHESDVVDQAAAQVGQRILAAAPCLPAHPTPALEVLEHAAAELEEYFAGTRREFDVPVDLHLRGFRGQVLRALSGIGYGSRASYKQMAESVGNPGAVRAVGSACANNPVPIFLPCHRVVRSDGTWGNYRGGREAKTFLLDLERAAG